MKIYTKKGDQGKTSLFGGTRVSKANNRIEAYGTVDELNSYIGLVRDTQEDSNRKEFLKTIQAKIFIIGAYLATDTDSKKLKLPSLLDLDVEMLENEIDKMEAVVPKMTSFIFPGGHINISYCHLARCICRRAERLTIKLSESIDIEPIIIRYLNRLSDYFFVLSRSVAMELNIDEILWNSIKK